MNSPATRLQKRARALCKLHTILPSDAADDAGQEALLLALEKGVRDVWSFAGASLKHVVLKMASHSRSSAERALRYLNDTPAKLLSTEERSARQVRIETARATRWENHETLKKRCEGCGAEFAAVNAKGRSEKRRRFCGKLCSNRSRHQPNPSTAATA